MSCIYFIFYSILFRSDCHGFIRLWNAYTQQLTWLARKKNGVRGKVGTSGRCTSIIVYVIYESWTNLCEVARITGYALNIAIVLQIVISASITVLAVVLTGRTVCNLF